MALPPPNPQPPLSAFYHDVPVLDRLAVALQTLDAMDWEGAVDALDGISTASFERLPPSRKAELRSHPTLIADLLARYRHMPDPPETQEDHWSDAEQERYRHMVMSLLNHHLVALMALGVPVRGTPAERALADLDHWPLTDGPRQERERDLLIDALLNAGADPKVHVLPSDRRVEDAPTVTPLAYVLMGGFDYEDSPRGLEPLLVQSGASFDFDAFLAEHGPLSGGELKHPWDQARAQGCRPMMLAAMPATPARVLALASENGPACTLSDTPFDFILTLVREGVIAPTLNDPATGRTLFHAWAMAHERHEMSGEQFAQVWVRLATEVHQAGQGELVRQADHQGHTALHTLVLSATPDADRLAFLDTQGFSRETPDAQGRTVHDLARQRLIDGSVSADYAPALNQLVAGQRQAGLQQRPATAPATRRRRV